MQKLNSELPWSLEYIPPSADYILNYEIENLDLDIESALCSPDDQKIFLSASIAFLQDQLMKRLRNDIYSHFQKDVYLPDKTYSDLLLVERNLRSQKEKYFIRLKNIDRYDRILEKEASTPNRSLPLKEILPVPKKNSWVKSLKLKLFKRLKSKLNIIKPNRERSIHDINILLRNPNQFNKQESNHNNHFKESSSNLKDECYQTHVSPLSNTISPLKDVFNLKTHPTVSSLAINRLKMVPSFIHPYKVNESESQFSHLNNLQALSKATTDKKLSERKPLAEHIYQMKAYNYTKRNLSATSYETLEFSSDATINVLTRCRGKTKLTGQKSKLPAPRNNELLFKNEGGKLLNRQKIVSYTPNTFPNFTDELKSRFSSNFLHTLITKQLDNDSN